MLKTALKLFGVAAAVLVLIAVSLTWVVVRVVPADGPSIIVPAPALLARVALAFTPAPARGVAARLRHRHSRRSPQPRRLHRHLGLVTPRVAQSPSSAASTPTSTPGRTRMSGPTYRPNLLTSSAALSKINFSTLG